jgi:hypothetical protein
MADWGSAVDSDGGGNEEDTPPRRVTAAEAKKAHAIKPVQNTLIIGGWMRKLDTFKPSDREDHTNSMVSSCGTANKQKKACSKHPEALSVSR